MGVTQPTVFPDVFKAFYTLLNTHIADPLLRDSQWIFSSNPYEDLEAGKVKYPIIVIEPADMNWEIFTQTKKWNLIRLRINAYSTQMVTADQLLSKIAYTINYFALQLKYQQGLDFVLLAETYTDYEFIGGTRVHNRSGVFSMKNAWVSGMGKIPLAQNINSVYHIASDRKDLKTVSSILKKHTSIITGKSNILKINTKIILSLLKMKTHNNLRTIKSISYIEHRNPKSINSRIYLRKKNQFTKLSQWRIKKLSNQKTITSWDKIKGHVRKEITTWSRISR